MIRIIMKRSVFCLTIVRIFYTDFVFFCYYKIFFLKKSNIYKILFVYIYIYFFIFITHIKYLLRS